MLPRKLSLCSTVCVCASLDIEVQKLNNGWEGWCNFQTYFAASASLLVLPRQEAKPGVESDKTKGEKERGGEMKMKSLKSDMHTWHAQTLSTCANILKQIFRHHLPLSRGTDWFTQMLLLSLSLWCEQLKVKAQWDSFYSVTSLSDSWDRSEVSQGLKCSVWFCQMKPRWFYNTWWNLLAFPFISMAATQLEKICHRNMPSFFWSQSGEP